MAKIMIDPGHAPGNANKGPTGYYEYAGMWKLSNFLKVALIRCKCEVALTRTEKQDVSLGERGRKSKGFDLFISQHSNACNKKVRGVTAFYSVRMKQDKKLATELTKATAKAMGTSERSARCKESTNTDGYDYYTVIFAAESTDCKHVILMENGFHDNPQDEDALKQDSVLKKIAEAQAQVICAQLGVKFVPEAVPAPPKPKPKPEVIKAGATVIFTGGNVYASSTAKLSNTTRERSICTVTGEAAGAPHPYHCISTDGKKVYGWVDAAKVVSTTTVASPAPAPKPVFNIGDKVKASSSAVWSTTGKKIPLFIRLKTLYIRSAVADGAVVVSYLKSGAISGRTFIKDLKKV